MGAPATIGLYRFSLAEGSFVDLFRKCAWSGYRRLIYEPSTSHLRALALPVVLIIPLGKLPEALPQGDLRHEPEVAL
jgi:hypothetical protein